MRKEKSLEPVSKRRKDDKSNAFKAVKSNAYKTEYSNNRMLMREPVR